MYTIDSLAIALGISGDRVQPLLDSAKIRIEDLDGEMVEILRSQLTEGQQNARRPKTRSNGALGVAKDPGQGQPAGLLGSAGSEKTTGQLVKDLISSPDEFLKDTLREIDDRAVAIATEARQGIVETMSQARAGQMLGMLEAVQAHFFASMTATPLLEAMTETAIERGYLPEATIDIKSAAVD